jgi:uncharacterized coiled-coil protein SlyX
LLTSQKLEISTQKDKLVILTQKLENLSAQVQSLQQIPKKAEDQVMV